MVESKMRPWPWFGSRLIGDIRIFRLAEKTFEMRGGAGTLSFYVLWSTDWVNVVRVAPEGRSS